MLPKIKVGLFPFGGVQNPYTRLIKECVETAGADAIPLFDTKYFPLRRACHSGVDILQIYWPGNLYASSSRLGTLLKRMMFSDGLRCMRDLPCLYSVENLVPHDAHDISRQFEFTQRILDNTRGAIVMSKAAGQIFSEHYRLPSGFRAHVVPHRNYLDVYPDVVSRKEAREKLGIRDSQRVVLSLGRIHPYKGLDKLIPAFLSASSADDLLLIAGSAKSDDVIATLDRIIASHQNPGRGSVRIINRFIKEEELQVFHRAADLAALSYADVPMNPGSLIMSMGFALPIVAPLKGAIAETAGPDALMGYSENDQHGLRDALAAALGYDDSELRQKGLAAHELVRTRNSRENVAAAFSAIYNDLFTTQNP